MSTAWPIDMSLQERLARVEGVVLDVDGCLILASQPAGGDGAVLPGAAEAVRGLHALGCRTVVFTNASSRPPEQIAASLADLGIPVGPADVLTPAVVGAAVVLERYGDAPVLAFGGSGVVDVLRAAGASVLDPDDRDAARLAAAVLIGWDTAFDQPRVQLAAEALWAGAPLLVTSDAPTFAAAGGRAAGLSGFIASGLTHVTGTPYEVLGKPSAMAVEIAAARLATTPDKMLVAGDDLSLEVAMANAAGSVAALVTTGTHSRQDATRLAHRYQADVVVDSLLDVVEMIRAARLETA